MVPKLTDFVLVYFASSEGAFASHMNSHLQSNTCSIFGSHLKTISYEYHPTFFVVFYPMLQRISPIFSSIFKFIKIFQFLDHILMYPWRPNVICLISVKQVWFLCSEYHLKCDFWLPTCCLSSRTDWTIHCQHRTRTKVNLHLHLSRLWCSWWWLGILWIPGGFPAFSNNKSHMETFYLSYTEVDICYYIGF